MELVKLPEKKGVIGKREIGAAIKAGKVKTVIIANNCPGFLVQTLGKVKVEKFAGNQRELGTKLGKPFPVAMVGYAD